MMFTGGLEVEIQIISNVEKNRLVHFSQCSGGIDMKNCRAECTMGEIHGSGQLIFQLLRQRPVPQLLDRSWTSNKV